MNSQSTNPGGLEPPFLLPDQGEDAVAARVEGPSFPLTLKVLATALVAAVICFAWLGWDAQVWGAMGWGGRGFAVVALGVVIGGYLGILTSRTSFDGQTIEQSWLWKKKVALPEITQLKLIHVRGLEWLVVPRLVVRRGALGLMTFHVADPQVLKRLGILAYGSA